MPHSFSQINSNALISFDLREIVVGKGGQHWQGSVDGLHGLVVNDTDWAWSGNTAEGVSLRLNPHTQRGIGSSSMPSSVYV